MLEMYYTSLIEAIKRLHTGNVHIPYTSGTIGSYDPSRKTASNQILYLQESPLFPWILLKIDR